MGAARAPRPSRSVPSITPGERANKTPWRTSDAIPSWSWRGKAGRAEIEVYSDDDQVELLLNGRSLGRKRAGRKVGFVTKFTTVYEPGELVAVGYRDGVETGRSSLRSAGRRSLTVRAESPRSTGPDDVTFVWVELADENGIVETGADDQVTVVVNGPAMLAGARQRRARDHRVVRR